MGFRVYPVTKTRLDHNGYGVKINGISVGLNTARVSAVPFNRRWPGHQRSLDQTELVNFLSLETDGPLTFEITPRKPFERVVIRPITLDVHPTVTEDGRIVFTLEKPAYFTVEPYGRQNALHVFADPVSRYEVDTTDPNLIYFGAGEHDVGMIRLESDQTLFIDEGAVVYACVHAMDADNIRIMGRGILDNSRNVETILFEVNEDNNSAAVNNAVRLHTVQLEYCTHVSIEGVTIRDSLVYNVRPIGCDDLDIRNVKIIGCWRYNSDGIDMHNCTNVSIDNCFLRTFDDSICVKGFDCYYEGDVEQAVHEAMYRNGKSYDVFKNITVRNCVVWNDWGKCLEIGAETRAEEICDVLFEDCHIIHVTGRALDCMNVDYADVHDIMWRNITIEHDDRLPVPQIQRSDEQRYDPSLTGKPPFVIGADVLYHIEYSAKGERRGKNRRLRFENIRFFGNLPPRFTLNGYDGAHTVSDVTVSNFTVNGQPLTKDGYELLTNEFCENVNILCEKKKTQ